MQQSQLRQAPRHSPLMVWGLALIALGFIILPILALGIRVPWGRLSEILRSEETTELLQVTLASALLACVITMIIGVPLALWMQNLRRGARLARVLVLLPLAMPPVVGGLALTAFIGRRGIMAPVLDAFDIQFAFAFPGVVAAHVFVALPFVVITLDAALRQLDKEVIDSAAGVGMSPAAITAKIVLPTIAPSLISAAGLAFARSLGEFGTTLTFAGSMPGTTRTMPLGIYISREIDQELAYGLSAILVCIAVLSLAVTMLPTAFGHRRTPVAARVTHPMRPQRLRELTKPEGRGVPVIIGEASFPANSITALIGLNGAGKTTLVGRIAGRLAGLRTMIGEEIVDTGTSHSKVVPAHKRDVVLLTQNPGLPPVATPLQAITMVTGDKQHSLHLLEAAGLQDLADVPVRALSGGQASQVALVRALAARPRVLILDEPLAAIDVDAAYHWRQVLRATTHDRTTIMITHNALDVVNLAEYVAVMDRGQVLSVRPTEQELRVPTNQFSARLAGTNWLPAVAQGPAAAGDTVQVDTALGVYSGKAASALVRGDDLVLVFPPAAMQLRAPHEAHTRFSATIASVTTLISGECTLELQAADGVIAVPVDREQVIAADLTPGTMFACYIATKDIAVHRRPERF